MRVVGLVSGGKDSIWNLHYCRQFGHEIACLANLAPPSGICELDSYMYQTVGYDLVDAIAEALALPLVRREIRGEARETGSRSYQPSDGDEVEDLTLLLRDVLQAHPDVQAVSCGAILSNYQRMRVESVCERLGLKVLAYMWMQDQTTLLRQMIDSGLDARIVKVACMGLGSKHVGKSILDEQFSRHIFDLGRKWGVHVCGEGGEYESSVLDAPLYERAVRIETSEVVAHPDGGDAYFMQVSEAVTEAKDAGAASAPPYDALADYSSLQYYAESFPPIVASSSADVATIDTAKRPAVTSCESNAEASGSKIVRPSLQRVGTVMISSVLDALAFELPLDGSAAEQCTALLTAITAWLEKSHGVSLSDAAFVEVQVRDLGCFESVNAAYSKHFGSAPPARVCIETPLPEALHIRMRMFFRSSQDASDKRFENLRVQSISTWAMACIGPYSQAYWVDKLLLSSGVIGLVPHSMALPSSEEATSVSGSGAAALQWEAELWMLMRSVRSVLVEMGSGFGDVCVAHLYTSGDCDMQAAGSRVLEYMRREAPEVTPLLLSAAVPRLPKGGRVELNVMCSQGHAEAPRCSEVARDGGILRTATKSLGDVRVVSVEFAAADAVLSPEVSAVDLQRMIEQCCAALCSATQDREDRPVAGLSLQVQYIACRADELVISAAEKAIDTAGLRDRTVASYMPVNSLGLGTHVRMIALASYG
eukprot:TRINITY_DN17803_c0_g1_i1.p1 TRINITY_DN17803_c0_g1~~TRINITY_DN17803_c0_g1_i1.p1  ORF type:complete len:707 (-),score=117.13 TRINITY_DN17803_c0_g1_i1:60-2180(-)